MGRADLYWSVDDCRWLPCTTSGQPMPVPATVPEPRETIAEAMTSPDAST